MRIQLPATETHRFALASESPRQRRARQAGDPFEELRTTVVISRVAWIPLTAEATLAKGEEDLASFIRQARRGFYLLRFGCSFERAENESFSRALFRVRLAAAEGEAVAWSMTPLAEFKQVKTSLDAEIGANLELISPKVSTSKETTNELYYLRAYRTGTSDPYWLFTRTDLTQIEGSHLLKMVVSAPLGTDVKGTVTLDVRVERRVFRLFSREAAGEAVEPTEFTLSSVAT